MTAFLTDRALLRLAKDTLTASEFDVWFVKHYQGKGRRAGSVELGISEESFRWRLAKAERKMGEALDERRENAA